jgi:IS5 family transposase
MTEVYRLPRRHETDVSDDAGYVGMYKCKEHQKRSVNWWIAMRPG